MARRPAPLPSTLPYSVFTAAEAAHSGVSTDRLRAKDLRRLGYGLYARTEQELTEVAIIGALTRSDPAVVARGLSAARLWSFPLPRSHGEWAAVPRPTPIYLGAPGRTRRDTPLLRWSRQCLREDEIAQGAEVRVTTRIRTWLDLAAVLSREHLVQIGDHLVRIPRERLEGRSRPFATMEELADAVHSCRRPGVTRLREVLGLVRVGSDSPAETTLRLAAARAGLPPPSLNRRVVEQGVDLGEPDLAWPQWRVCVEHDGPHHRTPEQQQKDIARRELREEHGWIEVQTVAVDLHSSCRRGVRRMTEALVRRGWQPAAGSGTALKKVA
jgi:hypothetical protein